MSYKHLTIEERNIIYRMQLQDYKNSEIARCLGRHRSTIKRECERNLNCCNSYNPGTAQTIANIRRKAHVHRPKTGHDLLMAYVAEHIQKRWSPEQITSQLSDYLTVLLPP
jgi:IS30 family transposase